MKTIDIRLKEAERNILKSFIGKTLDSIDHDEFMFTNASSQAVRFNVGGKATYLYSFTEPLDYYGSTEDVAVWSVEDKEYPLIKSKSFISFPVRDVITGVSLVQENQRLFDQEIQTYDVWVTRGIILFFKDYQIAFEKPVWFSEDIFIRKGYSLSDGFTPVARITRPDNWGEGISMKCERIFEDLQF